MTQLPPQGIIEMKRFEETFKAILAGFDFEALESSPNTIFAVSDKLKFIYFNMAWFKFSRVNGGDPGISARFTVGTSFESAISDIAKDYYVAGFMKVLKEKKVWKHEYECSSPEIFRVFSQDVYPLKNSKGLIVVNSLKIERPFNKGERNISTLSETEYYNSNGLITQCTNCRRTQRSNDIWDWVPSLVLNMPEQVSHSICPICYDYYWTVYK
jgi:hypothetical protein